MSQPFSESAPVQGLTPETWYVGRTWFYTQDPAALLAGGYDRVKVYRRKGPTDPVWTEITTPTTQLVIVADRRNYTFLEHKAQRGAQYRPSLADSTGVLPEVPQVNDVQEAVDTTYETLLTNQELRDLYAWGLLALSKDDEGNPFPERLYTHYMQYGIAKFEAKTRIRLFPTPVVEKQDYTPEEWHGYWEFMLDEFPGVSVERVTLALPGAQPYVFPASWIQTDLALGIVSIVPDDSVLDIPYLRTPIGRPKVTPNAIVIEYTAGFPLGKVPHNIRDAVGKEAISGFLNIAGDLVGGAAVASQSMSLDGLSQSVNTTSSATNAGFGSRLIQYNNELKRDYPIITARYKGPRLYVG
jgi:hypothetical protein